jgi:hypothetical protein
MDDNKFFFGVMGTFFIFLAIVGLNSHVSYDSPAVKGVSQQTSVQNRIMVKQYIVESTDKKSSFEGSVTRGTAALELLHQQAQVQTKERGNNIIVTSINNKLARGDKNEFWTLYVNGNQITVNAENYTLQEGDVLEWKIKK